MSTAGILRAAEVVFYHPLESDFKEHTTSEVWSGTGANVPGKIGAGEGAITSSSMAFGATDAIADGSGVYTRNDPHVTVALSSDKVVVVWSSTNTGGAGGDDKIHSMVGVAGANTMTWGPDSVLFSGSRPAQELKPLAIAALDSSTVMVCYQQVYATGTMDAIIGTVSGTDLTWGPTQTSPYPAWGDMALAALDSTHVILVHGTQTWARAGVVSGTSVTWGATNAVVNATWGNLNRRMIAVTRLTSTKFITCYHKGNTTGGASRVGSISGTDITLGAEVDLPNWGANYNVDVTAMSDTKFVVLMTDGSSKSLVGTVSGLDITYGPEEQWMTLCTGVQAEKVDSSTVVVSYVDYTGSKVGTKIGTVSGNSVTWTAQQVLYNGRGVSPSVSILGSTKYLFGWAVLTGAATIGELDMRVGTLDAAAAIGGTSGPYPSTIGSTRVAAAFWCKNPTSGATEVVIERGYSIRLTASTVSLGGTTAEWTVALGLDDNADHLVVLDFENTSGTDWNLRTSVDGSAFTNQGVQDSGTQAVTTADTAPSLDIENGIGGTDQWIDELVMWSGDKTAFTPFTSEELANLNDLADTFGEAMDKYEENYGAPICWQATASMPDGTVWRDSGSGPCPAVVRVPKGAADIVVTDEGRQVHPRVVEG